MQQVAALTATVKSAAGRVGVAKAQLDRAQRNYDRVMEVLKKILVLFHRQILTGLKHHYLRQLNVWFLPKQIWKKQNNKWE